MDGNQDSNPTIKNPNDNPTKQILEPNPLENLTTEAQTNQHLIQLRTLVQYIRTTREPSRLSLSTSLKNVITLVDNAHDQLPNITELGLGWENITPMVSIDTKSES